MKTALYTIAILSVTALAGVWTLNNVQAQASWYDSSWNYRQKITIASSQVDSNLTDFPVYVDLATMSSGFFSNVQSDGGDIRITQSDGTTEVARDVVSIDTASSTGELHFKASSVSSTSDTEFYVYYGNSGASNYTETATYGAENVWTNSQAGVWHLGEETGDAIDSTSNNNDGTPKNSVTQGVSGQVGQAYEFDGDDDHVKIDSGSVSLSQPVSMSIWVFQDAGSGFNTYLAKNADGDNIPDPVDIRSGSDESNLEIKTDGGDIEANNVLPVNEWFHFAVTWESDGSAKAYVNSTVVATSATSFSDKVNPVWIG
ncbi:MAG: hypothetical protein BRC25_00975, partial [Parcubacteria group bacterium SW_6_46_9]